MLYIAAFALGIGETLFDTAAQSDHALRSSTRDQLSKANGQLYAVELTMNQFVGPPARRDPRRGLDRARVRRVGRRVRVRGHRADAAHRHVQAGRAPGPRPSVIADIREGLRYLFAHRLLRTLALMVGAMNLASSAAFAIFVLYAVAPGPMGLDEFGFGVLMTALAIGSLLGSFLVERVEKRLGRATLLSVAVAISAVPSTGSRASRRTRGSSARRSRSPASAA